MQIDLYDDSSLNRSPRVNWVEARGGLPKNIRARARAICRKNPEWSLSRCIATAINADKYSESADDTFFPGKQNQRRWIRKRHIKTNREWERLKGGKKVNMAFPAKVEKGKKVKPEDKDPKALAMKEKDPKKRAKLLAAAKKKAGGKNAPAANSGPMGAKGSKSTKGKTAPLNMAKENPKSGKMGAASDGNRSSGSLAKTVAAYKKKKKSMSSAQRKKVEARIKSSQQQLGQKVGLSADEYANVDLAGLTKRPSSLGQTGKTASQPRQYGGRFGNKAGSGPKGSSGTSSGSTSTTEVEPVTPAQISAAISKLTIGQSITLPGGNGKVKRLDNGFQVVKMDGSFNKVFQGQSQAVLAANRLIGGRRARDTKLKKTGGTTVAGKATV